MYELSLSTGRPAVAASTTETGTIDQLAGILRDRLPAAVTTDKVHWTICTPAGHVHSGHIGVGSSPEWISAAVDEITADLNRDPAEPSAIPRTRRCPLGHLHLEGQQR